MEEDNVNGGSLPSRRTSGVAGRFGAPPHTHHQKMEEDNVNGGSSLSIRTSGVAGRDLVPHQTAITSRWRRIMLMEEVYLPRGPLGWLGEIWFPTTHPPPRDGRG
ncbi:hypothetical protein RRG08_042320 [Elysia crispata]|uniref:Uncharacterized protein n=1 Tax=Elysia crispata TaxID=231223 RepID=A0AAE1DHS9_9GAST|nr:hypothetical protein RRG08_042320 [Elysia crispata]